MSEKNTLRIHAQIIPETNISEVLGKNNKKISEAKKMKKSHTHIKWRKTPPGDRLLRNSSIACAVLLGVLALGNIDRPWAQKASEGIEQVLNMRIDLDDSIGELKFVKELMPESALVFLNISGRAELPLPVSGEISHEWTDMQPWIMFDCPDEAPVYAVQAGTVTAISPLSDGKTGILIDHGNGIESIYAYMDISDVKSGEKVESGQRIGAASDHLYFEWRISGESSDPSDKMGL